MVTVRAENDAEVGAALAAVASRVEVGPLGADAVGQLAGRADLADRILRRTRGHTLFVVEVLRALAEGDSGLPGSLRSVVQARVRRLGPAAEQAAAGSGRSRRPRRPGNGRGPCRPAACGYSAELRAGAAGAAPGGGRARLRVRQRPDPRSPVCHHPGAHAAGLPPARRRPAGQPAGIAGPACRRLRRLEAGGAGTG